MLYLAWALPVLLALFGMFLMLSKGNGAFLIAGFNKMSKQEQDEYDKPALCKFMGKLVLWFALISSLYVVSLIYVVFWLAVVATVVIVASLLMALQHLNTNNKFKTLE